MHRSPGSPAPAHDLGQPAGASGEESLRLLVGSVVDYAIFMLDPEGRVATWNRGARRLKQYTQEDVVGRHFSIFYSAEDRAAGRPQRLLDTAQREGRVEDEGWRVRKDGTRFWADVVITALRGPAGELRGFAKVTRDLTERKQSEDALRAAVEREREAVARLRETDRRRQELVAMVAHDLRAPVGVLHGTADTLLGDWERLDETSRLRLVRSLFATSDRLRTLVDDVLDVARIDSGRLQVQVTAVDLVAAARRAAADVDPRRERIAVSACDETVEVLGDEHRLWQVLTNLMSNALKFSSRSDPVEVVIERTGASAAATVTDRGIGISADDQARVFQPFFRVAGAPAAGGSWTGLGLYIAQSLAAAQGGCITVRSELAVGSAFTVTLPLAP